MSSSISVVNWGLDKGRTPAFRPAMALSTGELSSLGGKLLMMTATATRKTIRILKDQFPEIRNWKNILHSPLRSNVTIVAPPPGMISKNIEVSFAPFIKQIKDNDETYLVIVRSLNKGSSLYLHVLKELDDFSSETGGLHFTTAI